MANLTHLFKIGENVKYVVNDFDEKRIYDGTVKEVAADHVLVDIPEISDHMWFEEGMNLDMLYPAYNFTEKWIFTYGCKRKSIIYAAFKP